jgi:hypothetical protein
MTHHEHDRSHAMKYVHDGAGKAMPAPAVLAARYELTSRLPIKPSAVKGACTAFLLALTTSLAAADCTAVGHIKGVLRTSGNDILAFSLTTLTGWPRWRGAFVEPADKIALTLNVIVFGVGDAEVIGLVDAAARAELRHFRPQLILRLARRRRQLDPGAGDLRADAGGARHHRVRL